MAAREVTATRVHRWLMTVGALLTAVALLLLSLLPSVPSGATAMTVWVGRGHVLLSCSDELLFFAVICWGAGARGIFGGGATALRLNVGATALAVAFVALLVVVLAVGRLVYPVFGIHLSTEVLALVISSAAGALHLALLGFAVAAVALTWSTCSGRAVGVVAAVVFVVGSFPWLTPGWWNSLTAVLVAVWGVFLGLAAAPHPPNPGNAVARSSTLHRSRLSK